MWWGCRSRKAKPKKKLWDPVDNEKWVHDKFETLDLPPELDSYRVTPCDWLHIHHLVASSSRAVLASSTTGRLHNRALVQSLTAPDVCKAET